MTKGDRVCDLSLRLTGHVYKPINSFSKETLMHNEHQVVLVIFRYLRAVLICAVLER